MTSNTNNVSTANNSVLTLNATIEDLGSGVKNATVNVSAINSTINAAILTNQSGFWINSSIIADKGETNGFRNLTITAYDNVSNNNTGINMTVWIDATSPNVSSNTNNNITKIGSTVILNATITDSGSGVKNATVNASAINSTINQAILTNQGGFWVNSSIVADKATDGFQNLTITAYDNAGNVNSSINMTVWIDASPPNVTSNTNNNFTKNGSIVILNATVTDSGSGVQNATVNVSSINSTINEAILINQSGFWINSSIIADKGETNGFKNLTITAYDNMSNVNSSIKMTVWIDASPPNVTSNTNNNFTKNGGIVILNATITDSGSGVRNATVDVSSINSTINAAILINQSGFWLNSSIIADRGETSGFKNLTITAYDNISNVNSSINMTVWIDASPPNVTSNTNNNFTKNGSIVILNATVTDSGSGVRNATVNVSSINSTINQAVLSFQGGFWLNSSIIADRGDTSGLKNLTITAYDNLSNVNNTINMTIGIDMTPPNVTTNTDNVFFQNGSTVILNASITDLGSGVRNATVNVSSINSTINQAVLSFQGGFWTNTSIIADRGETGGFTNLTITAYDNVSNVNTSINMTVRITLPPTITSWSNSKTNNDVLTLTINTGDAIRFNATSNQTIDTWNWFKDDANQSNNFDNFTTSFTAGIHTVKVNATNANGTSSTIIWTITVQATAPPPTSTPTPTPTATPTPTPAESVSIQLPSLPADTYKKPLQSRAAAQERV